MFASYCACEGQNFEEAHRFTRRGLTMAPDNAPILNNHAFALIGTGKGLIRDQLDALQLGQAALLGLSADAAIDERDGLVRTGKGFMRPLQSTGAPGGRPRPVRAPG